MVKYQIATRAQVIGLLAAGLPGKLVEEHTGISTATQYRWWDKAVARGFDPKKQPLLILDEHVEDGKRTGRPRKTREEDQECDAGDCVANNNTAQEERSVENENENEPCGWCALSASGAESSDPQGLPPVHCQTS
jgi:hypothetical protein